jgi:hypothetical protein
MRISLLLQREPFGEILERTLSGFFQSRFGRSHIVRWWPKLSSANPDPNSQIWLCNPYLNAIFVPSVSKKTLLPVINEFTRSPVWWKRPFQKIYVDLAVLRKGRKLFTNSGIEIMPGIDHPEDILILGGNNHIRLLDFTTQKAFVIIKHGFDSQLLKNDIFVRTQNPYLPAPLIVDTAQDGTWYAEELILGIPVNRLKAQEKAYFAFHSVCDPLFRLYKNTVQPVNIEEYALKLVQQIESLLKENTLLRGEEKNDLLSVTMGLYGIIINFEPDNKTIQVAQTHGDLQPANILWGKDQTWLIDWEYTETRQVAYDGLVFALSSRFPAGLSSRVSSILNDDTSDAKQILPKWPYVEWKEKERRLPILAFFFLEEIILKLKENSRSGQLQPDDGFALFCKETKTSIKILQNRC